MNEIYLEYGDLLKWDNGNWSYFRQDELGNDTLMTNSHNGTHNEIWSNKDQYVGMTRVIRNGATIKFKGRTLTEVWRFTDKPTLVWKRPKPILDEVEKEYLGAVIKPFRKRVQDISKQSIMPRQEYIRIRYDDMVWAKTTIILPTFYCGTMYKGMELYRAYTLKELGL